METRRDAQLWCARGDSSQSELLRGDVRPSTCHFSPLLPPVIPFAAPAAFSPSLEQLVVPSRPFIALLQFCRRFDIPFDRVTSSPPSTPARALALLDHVAIVATLFSLRVNREPVHRLRKLLRRRVRLSSDFCSTQVQLVVDTTTPTDIPYTESSAASLRIFD
jgi:hypothetical protein